MPQLAGGLLTLRFICDRLNSGCTTFNSLVNRVFLPDVIKQSACVVSPSRKSETSSFFSSVAQATCYVTNVLDSLTTEWLKGVGSPPPCSRLITIRQDCLPVVAVGGCKQGAKYAALGVLLNVNCVTLVYQGSGLFKGKGLKI